MKTKCCILANGEGARWHNYRGVPKQLIEIDDEAQASLENDKDKLITWG